MNDIVVQAYFWLSWIPTLILVAAATIYVSRVPRPAAISLAIGAWVSFVAKALTYLANNTSVAFVLGPNIDKSRLATINASLIAIGLVAALAWSSALLVILGGLGRRAVAPVAESAGTPSVDPSES
jgi:hypothetical protein